MTFFLSLFGYVFIQRAFIAGSFVAALCAILGLFLVLRRLSLIGDGLAHVSFGAIALGLFLGLYPFYVAIPLVVAGALAILWLTQKARVYGDAAIGIVSAAGLSVGVVLASVSHGFNVDLFSYLFGNILTISSGEMIGSIALSVVVLVVTVFLYNDLFSTTFDEEYARVSGIRTNVINIILVCLVAITVVLAIRVVGVLLVSALLIVPAVAALQIARSFRTALILSAVSAVASVLIGIPLSFIGNLPTGATIVLLSLAWLGLAIMVRKLRG